VNHYTDKDGWNAIRSQQTWLFKVSDPPADHPRGAYFTTLGPATKNLSARLRVPRSKLGYIFEFLDAGDLTALDGDRGEFIFYSKDDYPVARERQQNQGATGR